MVDKIVEYFIFPVTYSVTIRESLWHKSFILTNRLASTLIFLVLLATFEALLILFLELLLEEFTLFVLKLPLLLLMFETEFLHGITYKLLHMESVKCYGSIMETFIPFAKVRKRIETLFSQLTDQFLVIRNYAKIANGLFARIIGKISALIILQYVNFINNKPIGRIKYALN